MFAFLNVFRLSGPAVVATENDFQKDFQCTERMLALYFICGMTLCLYVLILLFVARLYEIRYVSYHDASIFCLKQIFVSVSVNLFLRLITRVGVASSSDYFSFLMFAQSEEVVNMFFCNQ